MSDPDICGHRMPDEEADEPILTLTEYGANEPTMQLRRVWRNGREYLQQRFLVGFFVDRNGNRVSENFEWRDVPLEHN